MSAWDLRLSSYPETCAESRDDKSGVSPILCILLYDECSQNSWKEYTLVSLDAPRLFILPKIA